MVYNRKASAPWSAQREAGIESATVDSTIEVPQYLQPVVNTGVINKDGNWKGVVSSDDNFTIDETHPAVPNGATVLSPQRADHDYIDMTGFKDLFIALKPTRTGSVLIYAVMGPDTNSFANLTPVNAASTLRGNRAGAQVISDELIDGSEDLTADVWNIFSIRGNCSNQKNMQFKITNTSGGNSDITFAYMRLV